MKFYISLLSRGGRVRVNKNLVGDGYYRRSLSSVGMNKILAHGGTAIFS